MNISVMVGNFQEGEGNVNQTEGGGDPGVPPLALRKLLAFV